MNITIKVFENDEEILDKVFPAGSYRVGRSEFCDVVLAGDSISRSHLEFRVTETNVYMTNMSQAGRVKLNNERVETAEIKDGDTLQIGNYKIVVFHGERTDKPKEAENAPDNGMAQAMDNNNGEANAENNFFNQQHDAQPPEENQGFNQEAPSEEKQGTNIIPFPEASPKIELEGRVDGSLALKEETEVEQKPLVARLVFTEGPRKGDEIPIEAFEIILGRSRKADIFIDDEKLSRQHSKIVRSGLGYRLLDLSSRNGTFVNGMRILEHPLTSFDVIELGDSKIKFLILDMGLHDPKIGGALVQPGSQDTRSVMLDMKPSAEAAVAPIQAVDQKAPGDSAANSKKKRIRILVGVLLLLIIIFAAIPEGGKDKPKVSAENKTSTDAGTSSADKPIKLPPQLPKEYSDLTPELQRAVEGHYNSALSDGSRDRLESALAHLKKIHDLLPYYKNSKDLADEYEKKLKLKRAELAQQDAKEGLAKDLKFYLEDGIQYLREGDFDRAAESFNSAIALDPRNEVAIKGLRAAELRIRNIEDVPPERDEEQDKRDKVKDLFEKAVQAFAEKRYYETIKQAEDIRKIELKGETNYLNEAKQLIDNAKLKIREEFEPFLINAKEKYGEGDYNSCRDIAEEMIKKDPMFEEAKEILAKAKKQLNRLAKEAYIHGYILESMNRLEEAKQYWTRAKNYVRPGDPYYDKVIKKLELYQ